MEAEQLCLPLGFLVFKRHPEAKGKVFTGAHRHNEFEYKFKVADGENSNLATPEKKICGCASLGQAKGDVVLTEY
jgi:hypothetical protein